MAAASRNFGEAHLSAADGVVAHNASFGASDHPGRFAAPSLEGTSVQVRVTEVVETRVQRGRDSDMWLGAHFEKSEFPSSHHREEGWRRH